MSAARGVEGARSGGGTGATLFLWRYSVGGVLYWRMRVATRGKQAAGTAVKLISEVVLPYLGGRDTVVTYRFRGLLRGLL